MIDRAALGDLPPVAEPSQDVEAREVLGVAISAPGLGLAPQPAEVIDAPWITARTEAPSEDSPPNNPRTIPFPRVDELQAGTQLVGDFRIERTIGAGGFGVTYLARELALNRTCVVKEYYPLLFSARGKDALVFPRNNEAAADFHWGLDRYIEEAQTLARFDHPNIVKVFRYFKANGTGYMVLSFEEGQSLGTWLRALGRAPRQQEIDAILGPLLDALESIHIVDFLHRDIAPDNIIVRRDGTPVLIDFGSARGEIARHSRTLSALVKSGYSPYEQYAESSTRQGPWTDIYALGATLFHAISGKRPPDAPSRVVRDELPSMQDVALAAYRPRFLAAVDHALRLDPDNRPQSVAKWRADLLAPEPPRPGWVQRKAHRSAEPHAPGFRTVKLNVQPGAAPPQPGAPGQMLDYIEGLKQKAAASPVGVLVPQVQQRAPARRRENGRPQQVPKPKSKWSYLVWRFLAGVAIAATAISASEQGSMINRAWLALTK